MPDGHVRLALQTNARVLIACCHQDEAGEYTLRVEPPMEMERTGDRERDVAHNVRRVLAVIEDMILEAPEQWLMFLPVWGEEEETR
jgi:lauroyl/myristoyl acyltransferase